MGENLGLISSSASHGLRNLCALRRKFKCVGDGKVNAPAYHWATDFATAHTFMKSNLCVLCHISHVLAGFISGQIRIKCTLVSRRF